MKEEMDVRWEVWSRMNHPNVVKLYDYWLVDEDRLVYVILEYIDGVSFDKLKFNGVGPGMLFNKLYSALNPKEKQREFLNIAADIMSGVKQYN